MTTDMADVWGFRFLTVGGPTDSDRGPSAIMRAINAAARDRGINPGAPSDALDASRDVIIADAVGRGDWTIRDETLFVAYHPATLSAVIAADDS